MDEVLGTLAQLNQAWQDRRFDHLAQFFDRDMVIKGPAFQELTRGRDASVASYANFMEKSKVLEYTESDHSVGYWGDTAAASYSWAMTYEQDSKTSRDTGQDMFIFVRREPGWLAALRVILF